MFKIPKNYRWPLGIALALHIFLILALIIELPHRDNSYRMNSVKHPAKIVEAVAVNQKAVEQQITQIKREEREKQAKVRARLEKIRREAWAAKRKRIVEQHRLAKLKAEQLKLKKQRIAQAKALALQKKRAKAEALKVLAAKQKKLQQQLLNQQMHQDQEQLTKAKAAQMQGILNQYKAQIIAAIEQQWIVPAGVNDKASCILSIQLAPGGVVISVKTIRSSGNSLLDRSARVAVFKASPLPVPKDPAVFNQFRELRLTVKPEHVKAGTG